jgi:ketosteroid isomerase-like protein
MAEDTVKLVREAYDAWNRGNIESIVASVPEEFEFRMRGGKVPGLPKVLRGPEGMRALFREWVDGPWQGMLRMDVEHLIGVGDDRAVALLTFRATGEGSGASVEQPYAHVVTVRDGLIVRGEGFTTWERALETVGIDPAELDRLESGRA